MGLAIGCGGNVTYGKVTNFGCLVNGVPTPNRGGYRDKAQQRAINTESRQTLRLPAFDYYQAYYFFLTGTNTFTSSQVKARLSFSKEIRKVS